MSTQTQTGLVPLVDGQQSYDIVFTTPFAGVPGFADASVQMPNSSGEVFEATIDRSTLTASGCTVWLSGIPSAASVGGYINWYALGPFASASVANGTGIKFVELCHRIGRRGRTGDFTKLDMSEMSDVFNAANTALQRLYNALPTYFKEQTQGFVLPAPLSIYGVGVTQYSKIVTNYVFTAAQFGQSIQLDGDSQWNQIIGENELLNPYMGETGSANGTIYGNALYSTTYPFDRVIGNPAYANQAQTPLFQQQMVPGSSNSAWLFNQAVGWPQTWWTQVFGNSQGKKPIMVIRFAPAPSMATAINVRMGFWPKRLTLADYNANTELCVPDQFIEPALIPMSLQEFMTSPAWVIRGDEKMIDAKGDRGEAFAKNQLGQIGSPSNQVFTPAGF